MTSQLGLMCETLLAIADDIKNMSRDLAVRSRQIRDVAIASARLERQSRRLQQSSHRTSLALNDAANRCKNAATALTAAERTSAGYVKKHWTGRSGIYTAPIHSHEYRKAAGDSTSSTANLGGAHAQESLSTQHQKLHRHLHGLNGGVAFVDENDRIDRACLASARNTTKRMQERGHSHEHFVFIHGNSQRVCIGDTECTARHLAEVLRSSRGGWEGQPVLLHACHTGNGFAGELAKELGVPVIAPTKIAWSSVPPISSDYMLQSGEGNQVARPVLPPTGHWKRFTPLPDGSVHVEIDRRWGS